jgi:small subunit ribosomal protein S7
MSRKKRFKKRDIKQDAIYNSKLISMIINKILQNGKKSIAQNILYTSMTQIKQKTKKDPLQIVELAMKNITPSVEVKSRRVGGSVYPVPNEIGPERGTSIALGFLIKSTRERNEKNSKNNFSETLTNEILDASNNLGNSVKKKEELHKKANANKAFSKFKQKNK